MMLRPLLICAAALAPVASAPAATAPKFSNPEVTAYCQAFSDYVDQCVAAIKAGREVEASGASPAEQKEAAKKMEPLMDRGEELIAQRYKVLPKIKPEEKETFEKFMAECSQRGNATK